ncbi:MAG: hypothetical protein HY741_00575 [Chloroflexi bacterium]|nr:hypothetical protein [Chloroflexota bacterium]
MSNQIHIHIQVKHLVILVLVLFLIAVGAVSVFASDVDNRVANTVLDAFRPSGQIRLARAFENSVVSCGYFASCPPAANITFSVPKGLRADIVVTFTGTADTTGACNVHPLLDGSGTAFSSDPYVFVLPDTVGGHTNTVHWTLNNVPAGTHTVGVGYFESVSPSGSCSFMSRYLTVLANLH